jgi:NitT/TauT family transport system substrate-binding protein
MKFFHMFRGAIRALILIALAAALCAGKSFAAAPQTPIKFSLDGPIDGPAAPLLLALDKGYYKAQGLDVTIDPAASPREAIERVATGGYDMAVADINLLMKYRAAHQGDLPRAVFMIYNKPPFAIIARKSRGITRPGDLEGKRLGAPDDDNGVGAWKLFAKSNGIDQTKIKIVPVSAPIREPMLAAGQLDAISGSSLTSYVNLKDRGVPPDDLVVMLMADHGVELYGQAIIVSARFSAEHPETVTAFLRAYMRAVKDTVRDPAAAIGAVLKRNDAAKRDIELERLQIALKENMLTPETKANGFGTVDPARLARSIEQLAQVKAFNVTPNAADVFDFSFLSGPAERRIN